MALAVQPASLAQAREVLLGAAGDGAVVVIAGAGTKADWGMPGSEPDVVLETDGLDALVAHNHGDLTAVVGAGMPLARLQRHLAAAGQWLALDPASMRRGATVGGVLAAGDAGPRRHRYGTMRDLAIGLTVVLSDGCVARSGGQVIKNVAGYDLAKLFCGSLGTLGLVAQVSLRLHPLPAASATVRIASTPLAATALVLDLLASPVVPSAVDWSGGATWVRIEGTRAGVAAQVSAVARLASGAGLPAETLDGTEEAEAWTRVGLGSDGMAGEVVLRATSSPSRLGAVAEALDRAAAGAGVEAELTSHAGVGLHTARLVGPHAAALAAASRSWRSAVGTLGGTVVVRRRVPGLQDSVDLWGPAPSGVELMARVKGALDPAGRLAPGRFAPWF